MKKKHVSARLIALALIASLALSACNRLTSVDGQSSETVSAHTPANNSSEGTETPVSEPEEPIEPSAEESRVADEAISDVSAAISEELIPTSPSTLTPIIELGIGSGDYEIGYTTGEFDFEYGPSSFYARGNEVLVCDPVNHRLLFYRDGAIADKIDVSDITEYSDAIDCMFNDEYYYVIQTMGGKLRIIDRKTKEKAAIDLELSEGFPFMKCSFDTIGGKACLKKFSHGASTLEPTTEYYNISGKEVHKSSITAEIPKIDMNKSKPCLTVGSQKIDLELSPDCEKMDVVGNAKDKTCVSFSTVKAKDGNGSFDFYTIFYRYNSLGKLTGRSLWKMYFIINDGGTGGYRIGDDGELYVVVSDIDLSDKENGSFSICRVNFGMDEPFPDEKRYEHKDSA